MRQPITMTGMVLSAFPMGEFDKRVVILTKERGKITAFARGARRQNSVLLAATNPFSFGMFTFFEGRTAYTLTQAQITNYFTELSQDLEGACYGFYFMEFADYYTRENNDEVLMLKLLYQSLRALLNGHIPNRLVRYIFEIKAMVVNGEFPGIREDLTLSEAARYTIQFIQSSPVEKLYTFTVSDQVLNELAKMMKRYLSLYIDRTFKSLKILEQCTTYSPPPKTDS
ncbi:DNA repair protein RecO [Diplocloster agilis]|uniref:DNA repair protein RecO n=1 Tax=Diplocloster agilis TaxID=2850323 RepID=UPI00082278DE|nr:DNA repair protein RecO [Suonthocola fibrivorans]MCU6735291.1 DNA repair protein RecO [Suonthocola fibrivorans]SCJ69832.1 Recombination protein O [uncultured Clostridium sp.]